MNSFEMKLERAGELFSGALKKFDEETTSHMLGVLVKRVSMADELKKGKGNIKVAC